MSRSGGRRDGYNSLADADDVPLGDEEGKPLGDVLELEDVDGHITTLAGAGLGRRRGPGFALRRIWYQALGFQQLHEEQSPNERPADGSRWNPEEKASWLSHMFFLYVDGLMRMGYYKALNQEDMWDVAQRDEAHRVSAIWEAHLQSTADKAKHPRGVVWKGYWRTASKRFSRAGFIKLAHDIVAMAQPYTLHLLLLHLEGDDVTSFSQRMKGLGWAIALFSVGVAQTLIVNRYFYILFNIVLHAKTSLINMLYQKSMRIGSAARSEMGIGSVVNLQSNDASKLWALPQYLHMVWSAPLQIAIILAQLSLYIGIGPALAGLACTIGLIPINTLVGRKIATVRKDLVKRTDARISLITEVVTGIKAIKLYAWEGPYTERITELRTAELKEMRKQQLLGLVNMLAFISGPTMVALAAFGTYTALGHKITASVAFPALALFDQLRFPIMMLPMQIMNLISGRVALRRVQNFMDQPEMEQMPEERPAAAGEDAIELKGASFTWQADQPPLMKDINFQVPKGTLVILVGEVAAGKSSLLSGILGEMTKVAGTVLVRGRTAYTSQDPWIQNATLRDNILMGSPFREDWYWQVIEACALTADLEMLPAGDLTEIGEKGVNLSGGQRHRVALARAVYQRSDVYLLDDPLSAVDAHVGKHIFDRCVCGLLDGRTRVLATHQLQYLPGCDLVVVVQKGQISDIGTYAELLAKGVNFAKFELHGENEGAAGNLAPDALASGEDDHSSDSAAADAPVLAERAEVDKAGNGVVDEAGRRSGEGRKPEAGAGNGNAPPPAPEPLKPGVKKPSAEDGKLVKEEERMKGSVSKAVYWSYISAWGPWVLLPLLFVTMAMLEQGLLTGQQVWLSFWSEATTAAEKDGSSVPSGFYLAVYGVMAVGSMLAYCTRATTLILSGLNATFVLHQELLKKVVRLPMSFFDSQPTGRLLNRFTKDTEAVDMMLPTVISMFTSCFTSVIFALSVVLVTTKGVVALILLPVAWLNWKVQRFYIATSRELKRLDSLAFSPIFGHFNESLQGLQVLRAFRRQDMFCRKNEELLDQSNRVYWPLQVVNRWLSMRMELMGHALILAAALCVAVLLPGSAGLAGLAVTSTLKFTGLLNWLMRQVSEIEIQMNSVERIIEYREYEEEDDAIIEDHRPPANWPSHGAIQVQDLYVKYRPELDPVLKGLSFEIQGGEKIGVCGRTGCGKSTLMMTLYRIVEPHRGRILIDGLDTSSIGLFDLRSKLSLVPQDPVVFSGSVRSNLDPFGKAGSDAVIWEALHQSGLKNAVLDMPGGLDYMLEEGGSNLSVGQRQLLCMARALLRRSQVLVLDEATSNVDNDLDSLVQSTIRTAFAHCTVLTIAHRLHTIIDSDRILLLDAGRVEEFDSPQELLKDANSSFSRLVQQTTHASNGQLKTTPSTVELMAVAGSLQTGQDG